MPEAGDVRHAARGWRGRGARVARMALVAGAMALGSLAACTELGDRPAAETEILWDRFGIPHIFARTEAELFQAYGWAQMHSHGDLILRLYGEARGRAAEYWGEEHLDSDRRIRTLDIPGRAEAWYAAQGPEARGRLEAFVRGLNDYARTHPDRLEEALRRVLPLREQDVLAHLQRALHFTFLTPDLEGQIRRWREAPPEETEAESEAESEGTAAGSAPSPHRPAPASNAWAVAPSRSASGHALLLANPHLPWEGLFTWHEAQLASPGVDIYGATLVGLPFLAIAFNDRLGWTHTVNRHDGADLYELVAVAEGYRWDGGTRPFVERTDTVRVRLGDGAFRTEPLTVRASVHGPVVARRADGRMLALRVVGLDQPRVLEQYRAMGAARDLEAFEAALSGLQMPTFTVVYADADGHILHLFGGRVPVRPAGPWEWAGVVPGDTSATLWTDTYPYEALPRAVDPATGWLQNANDVPWTTTFPSPLDPDAYPAEVAPGEEPMSFRAQRSARMLMENPGLGLEAMILHKHSTRSEVADRLLDDLAEAAAAVEAGGDERVVRALEVLEAWDRRTEAGSRGAVLFDAFYREVSTRAWPDGFWARPWSAEAPLDTPDGLADPEGALAALATAAGSVEGAHGALDVAWGDVHRLRRDGVDLPASGGPGELGIFRVVDYRPGTDGRRSAAFGDSFVAAVEFSSPPRARALLAPGNATQPGSPHRADQLELFARQELRPVWRSRSEVEANLAFRERPLSNVRGEND